ncbi:MAG: class I SAM-dependent methyltransferase [Thaumarchaeota archaeon]|nr:class I SAM-dependent methyltransferase [Nitrososphaerota archaeon]
MYGSSLRYLRCVRCGNELELETLEAKNEIVEGVLTCKICRTEYPIISSIPILIEDLSLYFSIRMKLGGYLLLQAKSKTVQSIIKKSLQQIKKIGDDTTDLEKRWVGIYKNSENSSLESKIKNTIRKLPKSNFVIEHGCSIGITSEILAKHNGWVFGIDKSFFALVEAKKRKIGNSDFFLADSLLPPFGDKKFELVVALNVLELIEPLDLLKILNQQSARFIVLSDPYDYEREKNSVKIKLDEKSLRTKLTKMGFKFLQHTGKPSFIPWKLNVNPRLDLNYKVDLILVEKFNDSS